MADTQAETQTPIAFEVHAEIEIDAPSDVVWRSLIEDVGSWWPHSFQDGSRISVEPWIGGRFMEEWDGGSSERPPRRSAISPTSGGRTIGEGGWSCSTR
jgi:hypothetical protein